MTEDYILDFVIPQGPTGPTGAQGIQGEVGATGPTGPQGLQKVIAQQERLGQHQHLL